MQQHDVMQTRDVMQTHVVMRIYSGQRPLEMLRKPKCKRQKNLRESKDQSHHMRVSPKAAVPSRKVSNF